MSGLPSLFRLAKNVSKHSNYKIKMGAVIVSKGRPISVGFNKCNCYKRDNFFETSLHAEINAILTSGRDHIKNSDIFVYRETKDGIPAMAKPCIHCQERLKEFGVKHVYYSINTYPYFDEMFL